ncbi:hypothetical protein BH24ACT8_BH24ACT8_23680 [soil metagenome]
MGAEWVTSATLATRRTTYSVRVLSRKKTEPQAPANATAQEPVRPGAKNRPTPKRRDQQAARRRPLVSDGKTGTPEQKAHQKAQQKAARGKAREGMLRGEDRYLGARDRGPMRRYLRDSVDGRWNIGEVLLPAMLIILAMSLINQPWAQIGVFGVAYTLIVVGIADALLLWRRTRKKVVAEFGEEPGRGSAMYVVLRAFQMRMSRVPRPQVPRGTKPARRG